MNPEEIKQAHEQLVVLVLEVFAVFGLAIVAESSNWGGPAVMLLLLLWALFLIQHSDAVAAAFPKAT